MKTKAKRKTLTMKRFRRLKKLALWSLEVELVGAKTHLMGGGAEDGRPGTEDDIDEMHRIENEIDEIRKW